MRLICQKLAIVCQERVHKWQHRLIPLLLLNIIEKKQIIRVVQNPIPDLVHDEIIIVQSVMVEVGIVA